MSDTTAPQAPPHSLSITYPVILPISERHDELLEVIRDHQVVIVAGETGSGKSTQLPKMCLELGRGVGRLIGHTQPRRVAARTIAERVADELGTELGTTVGYTVRFTDRVGPSTMVKVMTDGILLTEIQRDRMLTRYDTLIIDEAHERSLNIDFILGYLRQLLPKRPDLKLIVTSATIDTERFAAHFAHDGVPAPIIEVTGRTYPVELRYRPYGVDHFNDDPDVAPVADDRDQVQAILDAVRELSDEGPGDILVFLSGEREIHDTADALRRAELRHTDVLPLYARLSAVEQHRIFQAHTGRRVVLSTNVAETSLTVPGVRYVIDAGSARISRYSLRLKVQRLPIEPVSQASANQRSGRCGRVAAGICIRLYSEEDFESRPAFTEPEILRTNLASVILQMTAIGLGDVAAFPFIEPPDHRAIRDGYSLLEELGAIEPPQSGVASGTGSRRLTPVGRRLARLPLDPRLGRMVLEAERHGCVREVMVIAAALSIQDPRERPAEARAAADEMHRRFEVGGSDFLALVRLWDHLRERQRELSSSQFRKLCRAEFLNYLRVREWQDLFSQLRQIAGSIGLRAGLEAGHPDRVHQALLAGLLSQIGMRDGTVRDDRRDYRGAHGSKFAIGSGSSLTKHPPKWVMAAELVETNRLWARMGAAIEPAWAEGVGSHLTKRSYAEPTWDARSGRAVTTERVSLFGLPIVTGRRVGYDRVDRHAARDMFILHALVENDWTTHHRFVEHNREVFDQVRVMEDRLRRVDLVDVNAVFRFYDERIGPDVVSARHFDQWWKTARGADPELLTLTVESLLGDRSSRTSRGRSLTEDFPDVWRQDDLVLPVSYRFDPGAVDDGVTVHIPLAVLNRVREEGFDWHLPGFRPELVAALVKTLPKDARRELQPVAATTASALALLDPPELDPNVGPLTVALAAALAQVATVRVAHTEFDRSRLPAHLTISFLVEDDDGRAIARGRGIDELRGLLASRMRAAIAEAAPIAEQRGIVQWDVGDLPTMVETHRNGHVVRGYPALLDDDDSVSLRILSNPDLQARVMRGGVRRLLLLTTAPTRKAVERGLSNAGRLALVRSGRSLDDLVAQCIAAAADRVLSDHGGVPFTAAGFEELRTQAKELLHEHAADALATAGAILALATSIDVQLQRMIAPVVRPSADDARAHLQRLTRPGFVRATGTRRLPDVLRYLQGIERRLDKLAGEVPRDQQRMREVHPIEQRYEALLRAFGTRPVPPEVVDVGWMLEELRISVFAQALGTNGPISPQRVQRELARLGA